MKKLRVLIADDHEVARAGVRSLLTGRTNCEVCGEASTGRQAIEMALRLKPDVIVMDITMPDVDGLEAVRQILRAAPGTQILILSMHESEQLVREIIAVGAQGYMLKSDAGRELASALEAFQQGERFFTSRAAQLALRSYLHRDRDAPPPATQEPSLTQREREVLKLLAEGRSNKEVAAALDISIQTVETHRANLMRKLGLHSITELVHYAVRHKIISL